MLTKILLTSLVIIGCFLYIRYRRTAAENALRAENSAPPLLLNNLMRGLAIGLLTLSVAGLVGFLIYDWNDGRTLLDVRVINPQSGEEVVYQVYKGDLDERSFTTLQGQQVRIANSERLVVSEDR